MTMDKKMASLVLRTMLSDKEEEPSTPPPSALSGSLRLARMCAAETAKENAVLKEQIGTLKSELSEAKKKTESLEKKLENLNNFVKRIGTSTDYMLKGSTSYFRKENQKLKTRVNNTNKNLNDIRRLNEDLVRTHELDRRAIEELSATISDLEFRIRMGIVSDEYTDEYCDAAHDIVEPEKEPEGYVSLLAPKKAKVCKQCEIFKLQLSKNSISLHCLVGRLKQMEESIFEQNNTNRKVKAELEALQKADGIIKY